VTSLERVNQLRTQQNKFISSVEEHLRSAASQSDVRVLRHEVEVVLERLGAASAAGADIDYVAFEDRFRGWRSEVREAQEPYLGLFPPPEEPGRIVDIGCGRGEMLELLREAGYDVLGVEPDSGMLEACLAKDLPVVEADGINWLQQSQDDSLKGIFCAQVVEHLLTSEVERLVRLGLEKLKPGGVLVVETINPRSLFALGNHFYADTSHIRPVHPETLRFICEQVGFSSVQLEERSPHPIMELAEDLPDDKVGVALEALLRNFFGYQDYVIVATK
jgi:O-antigen chain-terminating methyltransferase